MNEDTIAMTSVDELEIVIRRKLLGYRSSACMRLLATPTRL
jgi:hypothetical protein